jgi:hypothetical protein
MALLSLNLIIAKGNKVKKETKETKEFKLNTELKGFEVDYLTIHNLHLTINDLQYPNRNIHLTYCDLQ